MPRARKPGAPEPKRRSRTGCWNCKSRKIKCGEERPACLNCQRFRDTCDYNIRLNWGKGRGNKEVDGKAVNHARRFLASPQPSYTIYEYSAFSIDGRPSPHTPSRTGLDTHRPNLHENGDWNREHEKPPEYDQSNYHGHLLEPLCTTTTDATPATSPTFSISDGSIGMPPLPASPQVAVVYPESRESRPHKQTKPLFEEHAVESIWCSKPAIASLPANTGSPYLQEFPWVSGPSSQVATDVSSPCSDIYQIAASQVDVSSADHATSPQLPFYGPAQDFSVPGGRYDGHYADRPLSMVSEIGKANSVWRVVGLHGFDMGPWERGPSEGSDSY